MTPFTELLQADRGQAAIQVELVSDFETWITQQPESTRRLASLHRFTGQPDSHLLIPGTAASFHVAAVPDKSKIWGLAKLAEALPVGTYRMTSPAGDAALGWLLAQHRLCRYKARTLEPRVLLSGEPARIAGQVELAQAIATVRDMVDTPAADMGPGELEAAVEALASRFGASVTITRGEALARDYPMIHAVGQAATRDRHPRLLELEWGDPIHPRLALIGKGVCFDTGGLDIKPSAGMRLMKKDMGGAAHALALAGLVLEGQLPVRLHLLIPAVENAIGGAAFRPGDVLRSRAGLTVENTNTDAEGRLILADALTRAGEFAPDLVLDFATLTGAARVALGPDLPPLFTDDEATAAAMVAAAQSEEDPLWRLPLWEPYEDMLKSDIADLINAPEGGFAGAITAALFLRRFAPAKAAWAHLDVFAWRPVARPGRPKGGDAFGLRAAWAMLKARYPA